MTRVQLARLVGSYGVVLALALLILFGYFRYENFLGLFNIMSVLRYNSMFALVALGMCFVIMTGGIDLSVGTVAALGSVVAAYASRNDRPALPFWPMLFDNVTIRLLGSEDFPAAAKQQAVADLTSAARSGALSVAVGPPVPLEHAAEAHDRVDAGSRERVILAVRD